jgi:hypothetical protein
MVFKHLRRVPRRNIYFSPDEVIIGVAKPYEQTDGFLEYMIPMLSEFLCCCAFLIHRIRRSIAMGSLTLAFNADHVPPVIAPLADQSSAELTGMHLTRLATHMT